MKHPGTTEGPVISPEDEIDWISTLILSLGVFESYPIWLEPLGSARASRRCRRSRHYTTLVSQKACCRTAVRAPKWVSKALISCLVDERRRYNQSSWPVHPSCTAPSLQEPAGTRSTELELNNDICRSWTSDRPHDGAHLPNYLGSE